MYAPADMLSPERNALFDAAIKRHTKSPNVSLDTYQRERRRAYGIELLLRKRLYLDMAHWLALREVQLGRAASQADLHFSELLHKRVTEGKLVCPVSYPCIDELFKQQDPRTRLATAQVMDMLSLGSAIQNPFEVFKRETLDFIVTKSSLLITIPAVPVKQDVWTKAVFFVGDFGLVPKGFDPPTTLVLQKSFDDLFWTFGVVDLVEMAGDSKDLPRLNEVELASRLNTGKSAHAVDFKTFHEVFMHEVAGLLEVKGPIIEQALRELYNQMRGFMSSSSERFPTSLPLFRNLMFHAFKQHKLTTEFPSIRIPCGIHAAIRYERNRKYKRGDVLDLTHASLALPYFDYFLTERSLAHVVTSKPLQFDQLYGCSVFSSAKDLIEVLKRL